MNVDGLVTEEYAEVSGDTRVAKVVSELEDPACRGVVVTTDDGYEGVVTRRRLVRSHRDPDQKAASVVWPAPRISPKEDVREVAQLMLDGDVRLLPVLEGGHLTGAVTADGLLERVRDALEAATVGDAFTPDIVTVEQEATLGDAVHAFREHEVEHLPVVADESAAGMLSLTDVVGLMSRSVESQQGGSTAGFDEHGGAGSADDYHSHGGHGAREGELERMLDLPIRDEMTAPVRTARRGDTLDAVVDDMFDAAISSLVVVDDEGHPDGIVTKTDVLETLTWEATGQRAVQVNGTEHIDDVTYEEIVDMVEDLEEIAGGRAFQDVRIHVNRHQERRRGTPLLYVRARIATDRGLLTASAEGYGASHALNEVEDVLKRRIREDESSSRSKKHPGEEFWEKRFGWVLSS
jgi:CBS domain-containing protein